MRLVAPLTSCMRVVFSSIDFCHSYSPRRSPELAAYCSHASALVPSNDWHLLIHPMLWQTSARCWSQKLTLPNCIAHQPERTTVLNSFASAPPKAFGPLSAVPVATIVSTSTEPSLMTFEALPIVGLG